MYKYVFGLNHFKTMDTKKIIRCKSFTYKNRRCKMRLDHTKGIFCHIHRPKNYDDFPCHQETQFRKSFLPYGILVIFLILFFSSNVD
jgi:hypothetical protein